MIIIKLIGGLGNQMFQYAAGRRLAAVHNAELKLDISGFKTYALHDYRLDKFQIRAVPASGAEIRTLKGITRPGIFAGIARRILPRKDSYIQESTAGIFNPRILALPDNAYLDGYWQSEKYFISVEDIIRGELQLKSPVSDLTAKLAERISGSSDPVSLHIRRADYVSDSATRSVYAELAMSYYLAAARSIGRKAPGSTFFIFSDDISWARENLKLPFRMVFVGHNGRERNYEDLYLMSQCRHHIIANSTFSWWGAWLGAAPDKTVIAPRYWLRGKDEASSDRYPATWITM